MAKLNEKTISEFVDSMMPVEEEGNHEFTANGTVASVDNNGIAVVYLDGGDVNGTPCQTTVGCSAGDRVIVSFKNREPVVTSNITKPVATSEEVNTKVVNAVNVFATNGTFSGTLSAAKGTFAGSLSAATGTFAGSLSAATGTFAGSLSAAGGTFKGSLSAATGSFAGSLSAATGSFKGNLDAAGGTFKGNLSAAGGTFSGALSAATGDFKGKVAFTFRGPNTYSQDIYINDTTRNSGIYLRRTGSSYGTLETFIDAGYIELAQSSPDRAYSISSQSSDRRQKENIVEIDSDIGLRLKPVQFQFKGDDAICYGFIAQDVEDVIPNAVSINERTGYLMLNYHEFIAPTLALAQRNNSVIESLTKRVEELERKVKDLET